MASSPAALFDSYEKDLQQILASIESSLDKVARGVSAEQRKAGLGRVELYLVEAKELISQMDVEFHGIPQSLNNSYATRFKSSKSDLQRAKKLYKTCAADFSHSNLLSRSPLGLEAHTSDEAYGVLGGRTRLMAGVVSLEDGRKRLLDSERIALETEEQGADILRSLRGQREQMRGARDSLQTADASIDHASGTLSKMIRTWFP